MLAPPPQGSNMKKTKNTFEKNATTQKDRVVAF